MKLKLTILILSFLCIQIQAQRNCGSMEYLQQQIEEDPNRQLQLEEIEKFTQKFVSNPDNQKINGLISIPVVVHVVYRTSTENISLSQIQSQIDVLNLDFRRLNTDANGTWPQGADSEIDFCLATVDPSGNATNGVTRTSTSVNGFGTNDAVKFNSSGGINAWPSSDYLNFWICNIGGGILGYAQFPGGPASTDGVVCDYRYVGTNGTATAPFNLGRTATHEVGHWLNLRHIWGDGNCNVDDFVSDTPTSDNPNYGCATGHNSCGTLDMIENYMDYSDDGCMNLFTNGQKTRMRALFDPGGAKASLLNSTACGGTPPPPPPGCTLNDLDLTITLDNYPEETSWDIRNSSGSIVASGGTYGNQADGTTIVLDACLADGCYDFTIYDTYGDGICCAYGNGSYSLTGNGATYASGGSFGSSEITNFCLGGTAPTCSDGIQNQGETGVDCGGPCVACPTCNDGIQNQGETGVDCGGPCTACPTCNDGVQNQGETGVDCGGPCSPCGGGGSTVLSGSYFESGWDGWQDGGSDCYRYSGSRSYEGTRSIRIRDNSGTASAMTSPAYDVRNYSQLEVEFYFYSHSMENGEDFWVRYFDGSSWSTIQTYARGTSFNNGEFYVATVSITNGTYNFPSNARFRFQNDASGNNDHIYIDAVTITASGNGSRVTQETTSEITFISEMENGQVDVETRLAEEVTMYPNPASNYFFLEASDIISEVSIFGIDGALIKNQKLESDVARIAVSDLNSGLYFVRIKILDQTITQKLIIH